MAYCGNCLVATPATCWPHLPPSSNHSVSSYRDSPLYADHCAGGWVHTVMKETQCLSPKECCLVGELNKSIRSYAVCDKAIRGKQRMPRVFLPLLTHHSTQIQCYPTNHGSLTLPAMDAISSHNALFTPLTGVWCFLLLPHHLTESFSPCTILQSTSPAFSFALPWCIWQPPTRMLNTL